MAGVRPGSGKTPPIRFPWERAALGPLMVVLVVVLSVASGFVRSATVGSARPGVVGTGDMLTAIGDAASSVRLGWMALALLVTLASVVLSSHLASRVEGHD